MQRTIVQAEQDLVGRRFDEPIDAAGKLGATGVALKDESDGAALGMEKGDRLSS
ncbi:hypothetical protein [Pseudogulbenkiania sp. MAI-1]|uniref:hypothetical protein n=1 Tax=Pseudogulbenkiania sp. MAI-1 TaxID=990370 RepID=UPI0004B5062D|nr:hypothetical protein [Pseudogulbenkiania sp. MAI-1]